MGKGAGIAPQIIRAIFYINPDLTLNVHHEKGYTCIEKCSSVPLIVQNHN